MFRLVKSESKPLTLALAKEFSAMEMSVAERPINPGRIKHLRQKAEEGVLVSFNWAKARLDDKYVRVNGQHSATVLAGLNGTFPSGLTAHLDEYEVDDMEDLALLFRQFDDRKSGRSVGDIAGVYQSVHPELSEVPKAIAKLGIEGYTWYRRNLMGIEKPKGDEIYTQFGNKELHPFLIWLGELITSKTPELKNREVVGAIYQSWYMNDAVARTFWGAVASGGVGYDENSPETMLDLWLRRAHEKEIELKAGQYYQGTAYAWHAMRDNKPIREIKYDTKKGLNEIK